MTYFDKFMRHKFQVNCPPIHSSVLASHIEMAPTISLQKSNCENTFLCMNQSNNTSMHWFLGPKIMKSLEWSKQTFHFMNHLPFKLENASWATSTRMRIHFVKESDFLFPRVFFFSDRFSCWSICMMWSLCGGLATQICEVGTKYRGGDKHLWSTVAWASHWPNLLTVLTDFVSWLAADLLG